MVTATFRPPQVSGLVRRFERRRTIMRQPKRAVFTSPLPVEKTPQRESAPNNTQLRADVFFTWKKISEYAGRGIRTLQRWEREFGFPVHRPDSKNRSSVVATKQEIDEWFRNCPMQQCAKHSPPNCATDLRVSAHCVEGQAKRILELTRKMRGMLERVMETAARKRSA
jgi:hypothetical protein